MLAVGLAVLAVTLAVFDLPLAGALGFLLEFVLALLLAHVAICLAVFDLPLAGALGRQFTDLAVTLASFALVSQRDRRQKRHGQDTD